LADKFTFGSLFNSIDECAPLLDGRMHRYINLDNAASTPAFTAVQLAVNQFLKYYSSVHRGNGFKSQLATHAYERARERVLRFFGAESETHTCIFSKNDTESTNKLARRFPFTPARNIVLVNLMEHHSNDLPWRANAQVVHVGIHTDGSLDENDFDAKLATYGQRIALVSMTGASNVTGMINPIHRVAEKTHAIGAQFAVDCAQLAPHRKVDMLSMDDPAHLDCLFISAHKMYAPFGAGALIGRKDTFCQGAPDLPGGGEVEIVTKDDVVWSPPPERDEAGSPNTVGVVALGAAISQLEAIEMQAVADHEAELTAYALKRLPEVPGLRLFCCTDPEYAADRLGVIPFVIEHTHHALVAAVLGYEYGIGVRSGCFCAHPYLLHLLGVSPEQSVEVRQRITAGDRSQVPGLIRASFGLYNTRDEVDALVEALKEIAAGEYHGRYHQVTATGEFTPEGWDVCFEDYFSFDQGVIHNNEEIV
jgi:cysteine desulfurase/selenocysteine lyase